MTPEPTPLLDSLAVAYITGKASGAIVHPQVAADVEAEIGSIQIQRPNRWIRRALLKQPGTARVPSPTAAARRQATRRIANRSRVRNRR